MMQFDDSAKNEARVEQERACAALVGLLSQEDLDWLLRVLDEGVGAKARAIMSVLLLCRLDHRRAEDVALAERLAEVTATRGAKLVAVKRERVHPVA